MTKENSGYSVESSTWSLMDGKTTSIPLAGDYDVTLSAGWQVGRFTTAGAGNVGLSVSLAWPTKITSAINDSTTSITINNASASPKSGVSNTVAAIDVPGASHEIVVVTNRSGSNLTVTRGSQGTTAVSHLINAPVFILPNQTDNQLEQVGLSVLVPQVTGSLTNGGVWGGGTRTYRFTGLEASTTQVPNLFAKRTAGADDATIRNIQITLRPVRVG
jgi:hypothetical protein